MGLRTLEHPVVAPRPGSRTRGVLRAGPLAIPVALGRGGILANKREGDGATPRGTFRLGAAVVARRPRPAAGDRCSRRAGSAAATPGARTRPTGATIADRGYRPDSAGDRLRREDHLYDFIIEIDHNTRPRVTRRGSAVFLHLARPGLAPTAGCVAMPRARMRQLLQQVGPKTRHRDPVVG